MQSRFTLAAGLVFVALLAQALEQLRAEPSAADIEFFEKKVRPLLVEKCAQCHGEARAKGGLKLTSRTHALQGGDRGPALVAGKPEASLLIQAVRYQDQPRMPPKGKLADRDIDVLVSWVRRGAPWPGTPAPVLPMDAGFKITEKQRQFWSFQPVKPVAIPAVRDTAWVRSPIDRFILASLEAKGITPAAPADRRTLLRRVTFDLTGLPPTPAESDAFLADDSPQAWARVVDRLLASPQYGERWGRHWLDVVRYADARDLIQLPPPSDFREAWLYRDWVVDAFNRDLPYTDFIRHQIAGDLLPTPPLTPLSPRGAEGRAYRDGLVATGMLAIADFVPGDVDKDLMIADYVNDEIDVVGKAFMGLTLACARCHDHKFDPIGTEDYYALAGIFFSTRLIPGPVPGNTPLIRMPLLSPAELAQAKAEEAARQRRRAELATELKEAPDREYLASLKALVTGQTARYLVAACEYRKAISNTPLKGSPSPPRGEGSKPADKRSLAELAKKYGIQESMLAGWVAFLERIEKQSPRNVHPSLRDAAARKLAGAELERSANELQQALAALAVKKDAEPPAKNAPARASLARFRGDDPQVLTDAAGRVTLWPNRSGALSDARLPKDGIGPVKATTTIAGHSKTVLRFDGQALLEAPLTAPPNGSLFVVYQVAKTTVSGQRLVGWEDAAVGKHGLGLMLDPDGRLHAILRNNGQSGDLISGRRAEGAASFEIICVSWGPNGTTLHRNGTAAGSQKTITAISSDPGIAALRLGGPGSGSSPRFRGDVAEVRVYQRPLTDAERLQVEAELRETWFKRTAPELPPGDQLSEVYDALLSARGPFWLPAEERAKRLSAATQARLAGLRQELEALKKKQPPAFLEAVVVQDGGPKGTRHEGFKDAHVFLRGDHKKLGKVVPRGFPHILTGERRPPITTGSGRLQLADWLARPDHPLTARVMVNRIWQHHFGDGLVRTPNDFGERGDRPTHPELLDYLARRFVEAGWSVKALHRLILLSSVYQQSSRAAPASLMKDPDNRLFGRMNRRRLEAEAIRDSLLAVAGKLDLKRGGPAFTDLATPRRTLYLMSARTGANTSDFGRLFDRADPCAIVGQRGQTVVAPQALFFLNDPFVNDLARALAARVAREVPAGNEARIGRLYAITLGRPPTPAELDFGMKLLAKPGAADTWERYCHLILCTNEFVYLD